jgi:hypothetical protein
MIGILVVKKTIIRNLAINFQGKNEMFAVVEFIEKTCPHYSKVDIAREYIIAVENLRMELATVSDLPKCVSYGTEMDDDTICAIEKIVAVFLPAVSDPQINVSVDAMGVIETLVALFVEQE